MKKREYRKWTKEEIDYLIKFSEKHSLGMIAKKLKRTAASVCQKRNRLNIPCYYDGRIGFNLQDIGMLVGRDPKTISRNWIAKGLKYKRIGRYIDVKEKDLCEFMKNNPDKWIPSKCDYYFFQKYPWFLNRLEEEKAGGIKQRNKAWTIYEISRMKAMRRKGMSSVAIGKELGRSRHSVKRKLNRMEKEK